MKSLLQIFENENAYINEMYLINGFDKRLLPGVPGVSVQIRQPGQAELKGRYNKICFLILYVDVILLATNHGGLMHEVKQFLSNHFDMKDMGDFSYVIDIKIFRDRHNGILGLSQETYINRVLERFRMKDCSLSVAPIVKGDGFNLKQCPKNDFEKEQMRTSHMLQLLAV